jgi:hypothetical protein
MSNTNLLLKAHFTMKCPSLSVLEAVGGKLKQMTALNMVDE